MDNKKALNDLIDKIKTKQFRDGEAKGLIQTIGEEIKTQLSPLFEAHSKEMTSKVGDALAKAVEGLKVDVPKQDQPNITVTVPDVHVPEFNIPTPQVTVNVPKAETPIVNVTPAPVTFPDGMKILGIDPKHPLHVMSVDEAGKRVRPVDNSSSGGGRGDFFTILGIQNSVASALVDSNGVAYSGSNPFPITGNITTSAGATGQGDAASAARVVIAGNSDSSVVVNSGTLTAVTSITNSIAASIVDSSGTQYSGSNPLPVTITSGATATSASNIVDSSGVAYSGSNPIPVTFSAAASQNVNMFDAQASTITSHQDVSGDFRGLDITTLRTINYVSNYNSTTTTLGSGAAFTGLAEDIKDYSVVQVNVFADQVSATDGLSVQQSSDGTNWDISDTYTIPASTGKTFSFQVAARYLRIVYTNGGTIQGAFRIQAVLHQTVSKNSSQRPGDGLSNENDFEQVSAYLAALNSSGNWDRLHTGGFDSLGALRISQATDSVGSVVVNSGTITSVTSVTNSISASLIDSSGVQYSGSNPVPITGTVVVSSVTATTAVALIDSSGVQYSGSNPFIVDSNDALGQGDTTSAIRVVHAGDSAASVSIVSITGPVAEGDSASALRVVLANNAAYSVVVNSGTVTAVTNITNSISSYLVDSGGVGYNGSNPLPVTLASSVTQNVNMVGGGNDSAFTYMARTTNPTAVADGADVRPKADKLGRQLTRPYQVRDLIVTSYVTLTNGTETTLATASAAGFLDLIYVMAANASTTAQQVDIRAVSGGNIIASLWVPGNGTAGVSFSMPFPQDATGNAWTAKSTADASSSNVLVSALFTKEV